MNLSAANKLRQAFASQTMCANRRNSSPASVFLFVDNKKKILSALSYELTFGPVSLHSKFKLKNKDVLGSL